MGKAKILSGGDKGLYNIELVEHTARITSDLAKIDARLSLLATAISDALAAKAIAQADYNTKRSALDTVIGQYIVGQAKKTDVEAAQTAYLAAMKTLQAKSSIHSLLLQEKESKTKQKNLLEAIPLAHTVNGVWCADLTEDLATGVEVGTIEPNGEPDGDIIIYPGGSADPFHQQLQPVMSSTPAGWFLNMARFPGWQRWKPTFRIGTITALYSAEDYCDVILDSALSSVQNLTITPSPALTRVPVEYLTCNCTAFSVGDRVVVQFTGQNWSTPKVIGFESNPKGCGEHAVFIIGGTSGTSVAVIWDIESNSLALGPVAVDSAEYLEWMESHKSSGEEMIPAFSWDDPPYKINPELIDPSDESNGWMSSAIVRYHDAVPLADRSIKRFPESVYAIVTIDGISYTGLRTERNYNASGTWSEEYFNNIEHIFQYFSYPSWPTGAEWSRSGISRRAAISTSVYNFYGPLGLMGSFSGDGEFDITMYLDAAYNAYYSRSFIIPDWNSSDSESWSEGKKYALNHEWYGSAMKGQFNDKSFAICAVIQYVPCTHTTTLAVPGTLTLNDEWVFGERTFLVQAQAAELPEDGNWAAKGNNEALTEQILAGIEMFYSINGFPEQILQNMSVYVNLTN